MVEMDYRTDKEKLKDQIIEPPLREVKRIMDGRSFEEKSSSFKPESNRTYSYTG